MERSNWRARIANFARRKAAAPAGKQTNIQRQSRSKVALGGLVAAFLVLAISASVLSPARKSLPTQGATPHVPVEQVTAGMAGATATTGAEISDYMQTANSITNAGARANSTGPLPATAGQSADGSPAPGKSWDRMIVRSATLQLKVKDVAAAVDQVRSLAGGHAGYVTQSDSHQDGDYTVASITMQVPADQFDAAMSQLRKAGLKVLNEQVTSSDVTEEYTDLNSQLRNLQATEQRVLALTQKADKIDDILTLDRELRQVQGDIERIQGRVNYLSKRSEMSTITVSLYPDTPAIEPQPASTQQGWDPAAIASRAWNSSLDLLSNIGTLLITVAVFMWWLIPLLIVAWLVSRRYQRATPPPAIAAEP